MHGLEDKIENAQRNAASNYEEHRIVHIECSHLDEDAGL